MNIGKPLREVVLVPELLPEREERPEPEKQPERQPEPGKKERVSV